MGRLIYLGLLIISRVVAFRLVPLGSSRVLVPLSVLVSVLSLFSIRTSVGASLCMTCRVSVW